MITAWYDPGFAAEIGPHRMPMRKFALVAEAIDAQIRAPHAVTQAMLATVHDENYIEAIRTGYPRGLAESQKFPWSASLWSSVLLTNGAVLAASRTALQERIGAAVASGFHHARRDRGEGFCTFNGLVLAGEILRLENALETVAILDMDLHYGNGTAHLAETRPWLRQLSIYGNDYQDNVCYRDVSILQHRDGPNHRSVALSAGTNGECLAKTMCESIPWLLDDLRPDLVIYQAGADYLHEDPYSPLALDHADLLARDRMVFSMARERDIPIAWTLAGGYCEDIQKVVRVHSNTFQAAQEIYG
jgi:acetoin utilization deacetylase AcuC-like enzyme